MKVALIHGYNPSSYTGAGNNTYLIVGREPTLIDAAEGDPRHLDEVERALGAGSGGAEAGRSQPVTRNSQPGTRNAASLSRVLVTHAHSDHVSGIEAVAARWPTAELAKMPWPERDARYRVKWRPIRDGDLIPAGDEVLRAVHTPGHAPDHVCFFEERSGTLFAGDLVVQGSTVVIPASHGGSLVQYLDSLKRALALAPARLLPAHGPAIDDPAGLIREYLDHRQRREDEILAALHAGCRTADLIVRRVYENLGTDRVPLARESVLAHLVKLEAEGRVARDGEDGWVKTG